MMHFGATSACRRYEQGLYYLDRVVVWLAPYWMEG
jgi:hypothetical protein